MVAREGSAPSISGCKPDVMLFHHRALAAGDGFAPSTSLSKGDEFLLLHPAMDWLAEPVATIHKSPPAHLVLRRGSLLTLRCNGEGWSRR
jgi:hypothetical protein